MTEYIIVHMTHEKDIPFVQPLHHSNTLVFPQQLNQ